VVAAALCAMPASAQYGLYLTGAGPINRSMGGTAVAAPLDSIGATYWNPATSTALGSRVDFGAELLTLQATLDSALSPSSLAPGVPALGMSGSTRGDNGVFPLPAVGLVWTPENMPVTFGLGMFPIAGYGVNYPASNDNPILTAPPPKGVGLGALYSNYQVFQLAPTIALRLTDHLSIAGGPTVDMANLHADPLTVAAPNLDGTYSNGTHTRVSWGAGFQVGAYLTADGGWQFGAAFRSPQWFEKYVWQTTNTNGQPRTTYFGVDLPLIPSVGIGYSGFDRWLLAADFRLLNYAGAQGLRQSGFYPNGAVAGVGWNNIIAMSFAAQYSVTDALSVRMAYSFSQDPVPDGQTSFNVVSSTIIEHMVYVGLSYRMTDDFSLSLAYVHGFQNSIQGPLVLPAGPAPGSMVRATIALDTFVVGASVRFGPRTAVASAAP
jgi:long-chain fatty acid transport protein